MRVLGLDRGADDATLAALAAPGTNPDQRAELALIDRALSGDQRERAHRLDASHGRRAGAGRGRVGVRLLAGDRQAPDRRRRSRRAGARRRRAAGGAVNERAQVPSEGRAARSGRRGRGVADVAGDRRPLPAASQPADRCRSFLAPASAGRRRGRRAGGVPAPRCRAPCGWRTATRSSPSTRRRRACASAMSDGSSIELGPGARFDPVESSASSFIAVLERGDRQLRRPPGRTASLADRVRAGDRRGRRHAASAARAAPIGCTWRRARRRAGARRAGPQPRAPADRGRIAGGARRDGGGPAATERAGAGASSGGACSRRWRRHRHRRNTRAAAPPAAGPTWRELARSGQHREAFATLGTQGIRREAKRLGIADLFALADVARLSGPPGRSGRAAPAHRRRLRRRSAGAAGRVRARPPAARRPDQPRAAAAAFSRALELGAPQSLRDDVRARLDEAQVAHAQRRAIGVTLAGVRRCLRPPQGNCCARRCRSSRRSRRAPPTSPSSACSRPSARRRRCRPTTSSMRCGSSWRDGSRTAASSGRAATPRPTPSRSRWSIEPCDPATQHVGVPSTSTAPPRTITAPGVAGRSAARGAAARAGAGGGGADSLGGRSPPQPDAVAAPARSAAGRTGAGAHLPLTGNVAGEIQQPLLARTRRCGACALGVTLSGARWQVDAGRRRGDQPQRVSLGELCASCSRARRCSPDRASSLGPVIASVGPAGTLGWARIEGQSGMPGVVVATAVPALVEHARPARRGRRPRIERPSACSPTSKAGITVRRLEADVNGAAERRASPAPICSLAAGVRFGPATEDELQIRPSQPPWKFSG